MDVASYRREAFTTYGSYHCKEISKESLADGGFLYTNTSDRVRCKWCYLEMDGWLSSDNPLKEHEENSPDCPFILALKCHNYAPYGAPENYKSTRTPWSVEERLATFKNWPLTTPTPEELAEAGFYYTGSGDKVLCAHCGVGVNEWEPEDNPRNEHDKFSPKCMFLKTGPSLEHFKKLLNSDK